MKGICVMREIVGMPLEQAVKSIEKSNGLVPDDVLEVPLSSCVICGGEHKNTHYRIVLWRGHKTTEWYCEDCWSHVPACEKIGKKFAEGEGI